MRGAAVRVNRMSFVPGSHVQFTTARFGKGRFVL